MNCYKNNDACKHLNDWLNGINVNINPLFDETNLVVKTKIIGNKRKKRKVLIRHKDTDDAIIKTVKDGLNDTTNNWRGFVYIMGCYEGGSPNNEHFCPLYVGITRKEGRTKLTSTNIVNIERKNSAFARWGHGNYWHIGQLSNSLFTDDTKARHDNWAVELFKNPIEQVVLKQKIYLAIISWYDGSQKSPNGTTPISLIDLERELIKLSRKCNPRLLNCQG